MELSIGLYITLVVTGCISIILSVVSIAIALYAAVKTLGLEKSTHAVQYIPVDPDIDAANEKYVDNWATSENAVEEQHKMYVEELEAKMPTFAQTDDDKEIFSL